MSKKKAVVALSGGMDSATVLAMLIQEGYEVEALSFTYGSKHNQYENQAARLIAESYDVNLHEVDFTNPFRLFKSDLLKSGGDIPEGHYTDKTMSATVVPGRNIIFLATMAGYAESIGAETIGIGVHQGDHAIYPDCREDFIQVMDLAVHLGTGQKVHIATPFLSTDKTGILEWGMKHKVPYSLTRTCYKDQLLACGKCGSCVERFEAFKKIGIIDPVEYE